MVEWLGKVSPVKMSIDPKHLQEDGLADTEEVLGESAALSNPQITTSTLLTGPDEWVGKRSGFPEIQRCIRVMYS